MKCNYCGAVMPDPPSAPSYSETYKELREQIGRLEYENGILLGDKEQAENRLSGCEESLNHHKKLLKDKMDHEASLERCRERLANCSESLEHHQSCEKNYKKGKAIWKGIAILLMATNAFWLISLVCSISA